MKSLTAALALSIASWLVDVSRVVRSRRYGDADCVLEDVVTRVIGDAKRQ